MANPFPITVGALTYEVVEDREAHFDAVVSGAVTDEVTGRAPRTAIAVRPTRDGAVGTYLEHGVWCVACELERALPGYPAAPETFDVELSAPGYRPASLTVTVAAGSAIPVGAADVALRPLTVRLEGRLTRSTLDPTPAADGIVRIADRPGQALVSLRTSLHGAHPQGTVVRPILVTAAGTERTLAAPAESGARAIALDDVTGLAGLVVGLDWQRELEFARVETVDVASSTAALSGPLTRAYAGGTVLKQFTVSAPPGPPPTRALDRDADAGDGLLLLDGPLDPDTAAVQIGNPVTPQVEYAAVGAFADGDGFYGLDGVGGVETIDLRGRATAGSPEGPRFPRTLEYGRRTNVVNLKLAP
jgi:hypothetical protein